MSPRPLLAILYLVAVVATIVWAVFISLDSRREERWRRRFFAVWPFIATIQTAFNAAFVSFVLIWLSVRTYGADPPAILLAAILAASAVTALLSWKMSRIDPSDRLFASTPDGSKPKPSDAYRDLE
ncbi:hypothetical protein [Paludisphaera sp.]|uniref:hypothetical protein n=1 Tax=Paludisphaera sp. TaxID=2017432 RepID=UPI00301C3F15